MWAVKLEKTNLPMAGVFSSEDLEFMIKKNLFDDSFKFLNKEDKRLYTLNQVKKDLKRIVEDSLPDLPKAVLPKIKVVDWDPKELKRIAGEAKENETLSPSERQFVYKIGHFMELGYEIYPEKLEYLEELLIKHSSEMTRIELC